MPVLALPSLCDLHIPVFSLAFKSESARSLGIVAPLQFLKPQANKGVCMHHRLEPEAGSACYDLRHVRQCLAIASAHSFPAMPLWAFTL